VTRKQVLLEQISVCEGVVERLKAKDPTPALVLSAVHAVLADYQSKLARLEAVDAAADQDALEPG
jgi:hypothetical protein